IRLIGDQPHVAAQRAFAEQGSLGSLQDLDVADVEHARVDGCRDRRVVDIEGGRAIGPAEVLPGDAADADGAGVGDAGCAGAVREGEIRRLRRVVVEGLYVEI